MLDSLVNRQRALQKFLFGQGSQMASNRFNSFSINRIWQSHNLKPHRTKTFKLSRDAKFLEKLTDVVGLYLSPPQQAVVLCVDEKSQIQALDRSQPNATERLLCLPLWKFCRAA